MKPLALSLALLVALAMLPVAAVAQVKITTRADGMKLIYNETREQHARRAASVLVAVPDAEWAPLIEENARRQRLESRLVRAVIQVESGYNPRALSSKGAQGLMQLMPETARELAVVDPYDPAENVRGGTTYLRQLLDRFGHLEHALAAYNAGPTAVVRHGGVPPYRETRHYVAQVLSLYRGRPVTLPETGSSPPRGRKPYLVRGPDNRLIVTTEPPAEGRSETAPPDRP